MDIPTATEQEFQAAIKPLRWVLILVMAIALQYLITIYVFTMSARIKTFRGRIMEQFNKEHNEAFPEQQRAPQFGYPDSGNGRYAQKLPYADWYRMNNGQRCQINFLEHFNFVTLVPMIVAIKAPVAALVLLIAIFTGRLMFSIGYTKFGPKARIPGALIMDLAIFVAFGYMIYACIKM